MRITATLYDRPNYSGGPAVNLCRLLPTLRDRGHEVSCLVLYQGGEAPNGTFLEDAGIHCRYHTMEECQWYAEHMAGWILEQLADINPDVFIANNSIAAGYAGAVVREHGIPSISTHRSDDSLNWAIAETFGRFSNPWHASGMVCVSDYLRTEMERRWDCVPLRTIPSGVHLPEKGSAQIPGKLRILYAGRMEVTQKAVDELCAQLIPWVAAHSHTELTLVGNGSASDLVAEAIQGAQSGNRITLLPPQRGNAYSELLAAHDVIVLYSHYEGMPGAILDGMAHALVPLVREIPGIGELVRDGENGFVFPEMNEQVLERLEQLFENPAQRKQLGARSRKTIEEGFSLGVAADRWEQFLLDRLREAPPRRKLPKRLPSLPPPHPDTGTEDLRLPASRPSRNRFIHRILGKAKGRT